MPNKYNDLPQRLAFRARVTGHRLTRWAHASEHPVHLAYFGAVASGVTAYHYAAAVCLLVGLISLLYRGG